MGRCVPMVLDEGTAEDQEQAVAMCFSMWRQAHDEKAEATPEEIKAWLKKLDIEHKTIKAVGDWELEVLGIPFGSPDNKDAHGEWFDASTELYLDNFKTPLVQYYHGFGPDGKPQGNPENIGKTLWVEKRPDGIWYRILLDKGKALARRIWDAARQGKARASSGTLEHMRRDDGKGRITHWPVAEIALIDVGEGRRPANGYAVAMPAAKAYYEEAGVTFPEFDSSDEQKPEAEGEGDEHRPDAADEARSTQTKTKEFEMDEKEIQAAVKAALEAEKAAEKAEADAKAAAEAAEKERTETAVKAALAAKEEEDKKNRRLNFSAEDAPIVGKFGELRKYDNLDAADQALLVGVLNGVDGQTGQKHSRASEFAIKALAVKLAEDKTRVGAIGQNAMKAVGIKADEVMQQDLDGFGDQWVGVSYSQALWEAIRVGTFVAEKLPSVEVPEGMESIVLPLEGADPTFYKVAETTDHDSTMLFPVASVTSSQVATGNKTLSLAKMGARVPWTGELLEDSLIPFVAQLRKQITVAGSEGLEHVIIDGDNATAATTNVNDIGGTPAASDLFMLFDGFRVSPLVTTTANSRDGGVLTVSDFLETVKLMGTAGINALDVTKIGFILDVNTHWKSLELPEVLSRDVFAQATIEGGKLTGIFGYPVYVSANMHFRSSARKANSAGKVDQDTTANNTKGAILAVRWDQWLLGYRRRMTLETTRYPRSDSWEITALMRLGLAQRDTEASAISYNITV